MAITLNGTTGITDADGGTVLNTNDLSSQAQAEAGTDNATLMTPLRASQAITAQIGTATANLNAGAVGTYMYAVPNNATVYAAGSTIAGSLLLPVCSGTYDATSGSATTYQSGSAQVGTWRCMGNRATNQGNSGAATLWLRVS